MSVQNVEFINPQWSSGPPPKTFSFTIRAEVVNPAPILTPNYGMTTVRVTVKKVTGTGETSLANGSNKLMSHSGNGQYDSATIGSMPNEVSANDVLKAYIDIVWAFNPFAEDDIGCTSYTVPDPPTPPPAPGVV
jgi:hypothetical protein